MGWVDLIELTRANPPTRREAEQVLDYARRKAKPSFYVDENFAGDATRILRSMRARVTTVQDEGMRRHPDENHAAYALKHSQILMTCDRDLDERRFPLVHCPAIAVFDFGSGSPGQIRKAFACVQRMLGFPQFFDKWVKIDATPDCWTEYSRFLNGTTDRCRMRVFRGRIQEWVEE